MSHPYAGYWNQGITHVPSMTGATTLMDCADIREHAEKLGFSLPFESVLDVGCGTGRVSQVACQYLGVDIAEDAIAYCLERGLQVIVCDEPCRLPYLSEYQAAPATQWITCLSVFTHIGRAERRDYLHAFYQRATNLLVDIIPGSGEGDVAIWSADPTQFEQDITDTGWAILASYERACPSGPIHRYYRCVRAAPTQTATAKGRGEGA